MTSEDCVVSVGVAVSVAVAVGVGVSVEVAVAVSVGVEVEVSVLEDVDVTDGVLEEVAVAVGVGVAEVGETVCVVVSVMTSVSDGSAVADEGGDSLPFPSELLQPAIATMLAAVAARNRRLERSGSGRMDDDYQ